MGQTEIKIFFFLTTVTLLIFTCGIILFIFQYYKRKILYESEKVAIYQNHCKELLDTKVEIQRQTLHDVGIEIHDSTCQKLGLASIYLKQIEHANEYPLINLQINSISKILDDTITELRLLSQSLTRSDLENYTLSELIASECNRVNLLSRVKLNFDFNEENTSISADIKSFIFRILQEFIHNSLKHAKCDMINVALIFKNDGLHIEASDNGQGFDLENYNKSQHLNSANYSKGIGLENIKKRAMLIGGQISLESKINSGTSLTLFIPFNKLNTLASEAI